MPPAFVLCHYGYEKQMYTRLHHRLANDDLRLTHSIPHYILRVSNTGSNIFEQNVKSCGVQGKTIIQVS
jgi:hypothetical protein